MNKTIEKVINSVYAGNRELKQSLVENGFENVTVENGIGFSAEKENEKYLFYTAYTSERAGNTETVIWKASEGAKTLYESYCNNGIDIKKDILNKEAE
jgi:NAD/NADP transhydrogenase alpha subunit